MARADELTGEQWQLIEKYFPVPAFGQRGRRPRDARDVMNGVLWILRTGAAWKELPRRYPPYQTCHRHFVLWLHTGILENVLNALARHLRQASKSLDAGYFDQTQAPAPNRDTWQWQTAMALRSPYAERLRKRMRSDARRARAAGQAVVAAAAGQAASEHK